MTAVCHFTIPNLSSACFVVGSVYLCSNMSTLRVVYFAMLQLIVALYLGGIR